MKNVEMKVKGNKLTIEVDLSKDFGPSGSGKTTVVATTQGNQEISGKVGFKIGLNIYKK